MKKIIKSELKKVKRDIVPITSIGVGLIVSAAIMVPIVLHYKTIVPFSETADVSSLKTVKDLLLKSREALATKTAYLVRNRIIGGGYSPEEAASKQIGAYNAQLASQSTVLSAIINNQLSNPIANNQGYSNDDVSNAYGLVVGLNNKLGLPTVDWVSEANDKSDEVYESTYASYKNRGYSSNDANSVANIISNAYQDAATQASKNYFDTFQSTENNIINLQAHNINAYLKNGDRIDFEQTKLLAVLTKFQTMFGNDLVLKDATDLSFLINNIKGYSENAPYDVGSIIAPSDVQKMFNLRIDRTYSVPYQSSDIPSIDYSQVADTPDFDPTLSIYTDVNFQAGYNNTVSGVTWSPGEPIPGFQLHVRLANSIDNTSDSSLCKVTFELGVSYNGSSDVIWGSADNHNQITQEISIPVETVTNKQYIAQNTYYAGDVSYDFGTLATDDSGRITADMGNRPYLEDVLSMYTNSYDTDASGNLEYDFEHHNVILSTDVMTGIDTTKAVTFSNGDIMTPYETILHANQQIKFVVCDINTNDNQSALIGYFGVVDAKKTSDDTNDVETVKKIPSKLNGNLTSDGNVKIGFQFNPDDQKWIDYGTRVTESISNIFTVGDTLKSHWNDYAGVENTIDTVLLYQEIAIGFRALTIAAAVAAAVVDAVSFNFTALAMDAIVIAINTGAAVVEGMIINIETHIKNDALSVEKTTGAVVGFDPNTNKFSAASLEELQVTWADWNANGNKTDKFVNFISQAKDFLINPRGVIEKKVQCAQQVNAVITDTSTTFQNVPILQYLESWLIQSYNDFRGNHGEDPLSTSDIDQINDDFTELDPTNDTSDLHAINVSALVNESTSLSAYAIVDTFEYVSQEGDQSDDRIAKFEKLITQLRDELNDVLIQMDSSALGSLGLPADIFQTSDILLTLVGIVKDIKEIKAILSGIEMVSQNAMKLSTLLAVIGEVLSIVSLICTFCADAALNWAPSDSKK